MGWKHFKSNSNSLKENHLKTLPPKGHLPCLCPRWDQLGTPTAMASPENSQTVKKTLLSLFAPVRLTLSLFVSVSHFASVCLGLSHFVSVWLSLSRVVSVFFIVSQFIILSQYILSLFQFLWVYLQPQHLCQRFWCPHRGRPCSELPRRLFRTPSLHSWFKRELI